MEELVKRLSIPIPTWILRRRIRIRCQIHKNTNKSRIYIDALDPDIPYTIFKSIQLITNGQIEHLNVKHFTKEEQFYLLYNPFTRQWQRTIDEN